MLNLHQLRAFVAVAETEHVGRAAEQLHISQSPLSRLIIQLEAQLGLNLFERVRQRVRLTPNGRLFLEEARALLAQAERIETSARQLGSGEAGTLAIGYVEAAMHSGFLPRVLNRLRTTRPAMQVTLHALRSAPQIKALRHRDLDVALLYTPPPLTDTSMVSVKVVNDALVLALPAEHPLAGNASLRPQDLDGLAWIAMPQALNPVARDRFMAACLASGFTPQIKLEVAETLTALGLVGEGLGATLVQASLRDISFSQVVFRDLLWFPLSVNVYATWRHADTTPLVAAFRETIECCAVA